MKGAAPFLATSFILATSFACSRWPPLESGATDYFYAHRTALEQIMEALRTDQLEGISTAYWDGSVIFREPLSPELVAKYRDLFANAGRAVDAAWRVGGVTQTPDRGVFVFSLFSHSDSRTQFLISYFYDPDPVKAVVCGNVTDPPDCGTCQVHLSDDWYLFYRWYPLDISPELTEEYSDGPVTLERHLQITEPLYDACFAAGEDFLRKAK